ncbi:FMN-linked oxidoreductase [Aureobasidium pullulans]|uniref:FMN-linked oxidoreductase n=1 Tax=Aureobasidium pullulans TaxID=5580 RepID=A0A4S9WAS2_AURPU|nr:FMN-linked oxidoreductase [Aureobasidium pullulans]THZ40335.1 FMN-linked oxidoreductase [Aureobasidium pullulans]THZ61968.1 FMN-linked oxidoreductase [Aureobasidium pullulans]THZ64461.1 FMN-linked oxidoreductase [Aureobasidium pullulans]
MSATKLFEPLKLGTVQLQHRVVMAPLTRLRADKEHVQLPMAIDYYSQRASSGGLIIAEAVLVSPEHGGFRHAPGIYTEPQINRWKEITDAVHAKGGFIYAQLVSVGRVADTGILKEEGNFPLISSSETPFTEGPDSLPHALTEEEIKRAVSTFAQASRNAMAAGFDGIELHGANGYLIDQFTQDTCNRRKDSYGGSVENRSRFALEVTSACVDAIGAENVGFRISPFSTFQGMKMADPISQFSHLVRGLKDLKLSYLHIIESRVINNVDCEKQEGIEPFIDIWGRTSPVLVAGGFTPESAKHAVDVEYKDVDAAVVFGRHFISNPDLPMRIKKGVELNGYDRSTFYTPMQKEGYLDYPFFEQSKEVDVRA